MSRRRETEMPFPPKQFCAILREPSWQLCAPLITAGSQRVFFFSSPIFVTQILSSQLEGGSGRILNSIFALTVKTVPYVTMLFKLIRAARQIHLRNKMPPTCRFTAELPVWSLSNLSPCLLRGAFAILQDAVDKSWSLDLQRRCTVASSGWTPLLQFS